MQKIKYSAGSSSAFFRSLDSEVKQLVASSRLLSKARRKLWIKLVFYSLLHALAWSALFLLPVASTGGLILNYVCIGLSGLFLGFNVSHDAMHGTFSRNKIVNNWLYHFSFNIQGTNAYLWKVRHIGSHHVFPNVDGCDADIDDNPFIRLSPQHPLRSYQRYQHLYSIAVYCFYTIHWIFFKDLFYLYSKKVGNLQQKKNPLKQKILFFVWKAAYLSLALLLPVVKGYAFTDVLLSFFIMHIINSLCFIHFLIATHLSMETVFPQTGPAGFLPGDYYTHQLATSLDYSPASKLLNWLLGGFNAHAAHHLYPKLPHTAYPVISVLIELKAKEFGLPYNKSNLFRAIRSHYRYLKKMGTTEKPSCKDCELREGCKTIA